MASQPIRHLKRTNWIKCLADKIFVYFCLLINYFIKLNVTIIMVIKRQINPVKKIISATFSYWILFSDLLRIERKDKILLLINRIVAIEVHSSINVVPLNFKTFKEVSTRKQIPNKFAEVFKMCEALLLLFVM